MKKQVLGILMALLSMLVPCQVMAQEIIEVVDSIPDFVDFCQLKFCILIIN